MATKRTTPPTDSRFDQLVNNPDQYFAEARQRASAVVDRQIQRELSTERAQRRAGFRRNDEPADY